MKGVVYISGPMTGLPNFNFDNFNRVAKYLRALGYEVINPAENFNGKTDLPRDEYMREDIKNVMDANTIVVLDGWTESKGAVTEVRIAREIGLDIYNEELNRINQFADRFVFEETVFDKGKQLVYGDRNKSYGHPGPNLHDTVDMFRVWVNRRYGMDVPFTAKDGAMFMQFVKIAREAHSTKEDNWIDGIGYWGCVERIEKNI